MFVHTRPLSSSNGTEYWYFIRIRSCPTLPAGVHGRYLVLCLGGLQATVQAEVERHLAAAGHRAEVRVFSEDCRGKNHATPII